MDQRQHAARAKGSAQTRTQDRPCRQCAPLAGQRGQKPLTIRAVIDPDAQPVGPDIEAKAVAALDGLKGRDMKNLLCAQRILARDGPLIGMGAQIAVPVAKGVGDLGDHGAKRACIIMGEPK